MKLVLCDDRIDFNRRNKYGMDALWISASNGHLKVVEYLLNSGKKFNLHSKWDVDTSKHQANNKTVIEQVKYQISSEKIKFSWEADKTLQNIIENGSLILELLEQYHKNEVDEKFIEKEVEKERIEQKEEMQKEKEKEEMQDEKSHQKDEIVLTGEFLKLTGIFFKKWKPRIFDLRLQSLAWKKYQNVIFFFFHFSFIYLFIDFID